MCQLLFEPHQHKAKERGYCLSLLLGAAGRLRFPKFRPPHTLTPRFFCHLQRGTTWQDSHLRFSSTTDYQKEAPRFGVLLFGAADGTRTRTVSPPGDFKSPVSTDSTTAACDNLIILPHF